MTEWLTGIDAHGKASGLLCCGSERHIGMGNQTKEDAVQMLKAAVAQFSEANAGQVEVKGGPSIQKGMPDWHYVHYAEIRRKQDDSPMLYLLVEYIPWAEEASIFAYVLKDAKVFSLAKQGTGNEKERQRMVQGVAEAVAAGEFA